MLTNDDILDHVANVVSALALAIRERQAAEGRDIWAELNYLRCRVTDAELDNSLGDTEQVRQHLWAARQSIDRVCGKIERLPEEEEPSDILHDD